MRKPSPSSPSPVRVPPVVYVDGTPYAIRGAIVRPYTAKPVRLSGTISREIAHTGFAEHGERAIAMPSSGSYFFPISR